METVNQGYVEYLQTLLKQHNVQYKSVEEFSNVTAPETQLIKEAFYPTNIDPSILSTQQIERYSRQMLLREIAYPGQIKLKKSKVAIIGCGGIGCPGSLYLAAAGVGTLGLFDSDKVELNNLHRQVAHKTASIGVQKSISLQSTLHSLNSFIKINRHPFIAQSTLSNLDQYDIVIDGSDNPKCRYMVNDYCVKKGKTLFSGACIGWEAQITAFDGNTACYRCLWGDDQVSTGGCATRGVVGMVPGLVGLILGIEALKFIVLGNRELFGNMLLYDALSTSFRKTKLRNKKGDCTVCSSKEFEIENYDYSKYDPACGIAPPNVPSISWTEVISKSIPPTSILDVRSDSMFGIINLKGTVNIPLEQLRSLSSESLEKALNGIITPEKQIYVMCRRGNDSKRATKLLEEKGYKAVNIIGGIEQYGKELAVQVPSV